MTSRQAYNIFLLKINKVDTNTEIAILVPYFVLLYNIESKRWLADQLRRKETSDDINDINELLVHNYELFLSSVDIKHDDFVLLENFFSYSSSFVVANNGKCSDYLLVKPIMPKNKDVYYEDENRSLSFEWRETFSYLADNSLIVYKKDFIIEKALIDYYRKLIDIDIEGYENSEGLLSKNIDLDIDDIWVNEIIDRCALEVIREYENPSGVELAANRLNLEL